MMSFIEHENIAKLAGMVPGNPHLSRAESKCEHCRCDYHADSLGENGGLCHSCASAKSDYLDGNEDELEELELYETGVFFGEQIHYRRE